MGKFVPLNSEAHKGFFWKRPENFLFAKNFGIVPVVNFELGPACVNYPLCFVSEGERYLLVAILGLNPRENWFVSDEGRWLSSYVPVYFRVYPFRLLRGGENQLVLTVDEEALSDIGGEPLFVEDGKLSPQVEQIRNFLVRIEQARMITQKMVDLISQKNLIDKWEIKIKTPAGERELSGIFRINEKRLNELKNEEFLELKMAGALGLIFAQLFSMNNLVKLPQLLQERGKKEDSPVEELEKTLKELKLPEQ